MWGELIIYSKDDRYFVALKFQDWKIIKICSNKKKKKSNDTIFLGNNDFFPIYLDLNNGPYSWNSNFHFKSIKGKS